MRGALAALCVAALWFAFAWLCAVAIGDACPPP
jgi:hypothetical protein